MDDHRATEDRALTVLLDVRLDRQPITGRLRTEHGDDEPFVGWLGFVDALQRLHRQCPGDPAAPRDAHDAEGVHPQ